MVRSTWCQGWNRWNATLPARIPPRADRGQIAMEKVTKSSTNHFTRLNRPLTLRQIAQLCRCTRICTAACTIPAHVRHCCPRRCIPTSFAVRTLDSIRRVWTQQSGEVMNAAECDQGESRNAAKFGGHNIFPMGPEVSSTIKAIQPSFHNTRMLLSHTDYCETSCIKHLLSQVGRAAAMRQDGAHTCRIRRQVCCLY
jgi:hypothetical protein